MEFHQSSIQLSAYPRGFHLITNQIVDNFPAIKKISKGMLQMFIQHTSAGLTINENADPSVRSDFETFINDMVPEDYPDFVHTYEGPDDMPAHIKGSLVGFELNIPITNGKLNLGTWQGIYLCEFRNHGGRRRIVLTAFGA